MAFRTSLAKYIETLRHTALYPKQLPASSSAPSQAQARAKPKPGDNAPEDDAAHVQAWWWKDVVVRKSLLEECGGEK